MSEKKVAIMQPYFLPYLGYFSLILATDVWIFFDTAQYIRHGWVNRNRILKPSKDDWQYIIVPLEKHHREIPINKVALQSNGWQSKIIAQLEHYRKKARYYSDVLDLVHQILFAKEAQNSLVKLNSIGVKKICEYCSIPFAGSIFSEMNLKLDTVSAPDEWALEITKSIGGGTYVNPIGGVKFFDKKKYEDAGIELCFLRNNLLPYRQPNSDFIPGLSIIDAMMFCDPNEVKSMVEEYEFL